MIQLQTLSTSLLNVAIARAFYVVQVPNDETMSTEQLNIRTKLI
jgi:hypothetical protein